MPGPKTHEIFYRKLKGLLPSQVTAALPGYDICSIFAQGHDLFLYGDYWKVWQLGRHIQESVLLQEYDFQEFVFQYLLSAQKACILQEEETYLFLCPGYVAHHILDSYLHPLIIHYSGDHTRDKRNSTWRHGIIETLLDAWMTWHFDGIWDCSRRIDQDFDYLPKRLSPMLSQLLDYVFSEVYGLQSGGKKVEKGIRQTAQFMRVLKYDPSGVKKKFFEWADPVLKGSASFSYCVNPASAEEYLNLEHEIWGNPQKPELQSRQSMLDLFDEALRQSAAVCTDIFSLVSKGTGITREAVYKMIPNRSSNYGLPCRLSFSETHCVKD